MRYDLLKLELFGPDGTPCAKKILVPTTPHRLPISSHAQTIQKLWKEGIDATGFLIPDEELARLSLDNPSWPPNNVFIARADLSRQWDQYAPKQPPSGNDGGRGLKKEALPTTPASPVQPPKPTVSSVTLVDELDFLKPRPGPSRLKSKSRTPNQSHETTLPPEPTIQEKTTEPIQRPNRLKSRRTPDKGD